MKTGEKLCFWFTLTVIVIGFLFIGALFCAGFASCVKRAVNQFPYTGKAKMTAAVVSAAVVGDLSGRYRCLVLGHKDTSAARGGRAGDNFFHKKNESATQRANHTRSAYASKPAGIVVTLAKRESRRA